MSSKTQLQDQILALELKLADLRELWRQSPLVERSEITRRGKQIKEQIETVQQDISFYDRIDKAKQNAKEVGKKRREVKRV